MFRSKSSNSKHLQVIACSSIFVALSIICGKYLQIPIGEILRFSFENLPIIFSGIVFGPIVGLAVGILADLLGCVLVGYAINPLITLGAAVIGLFSGLCAYLSKRLPLTVRLIPTVAIPHFLGSVVIKTIGLASWYDMPILELMLWRLLNYTIVGVLEYILLLVILKSKAITSQINSITGE